MPSIKFIRKLLIWCLLLPAICGLMACAPLRMTAEHIDDLQRSANAGNAKAQVIVGEIYEFGVTVPVNPLIAAQWYQLAAKQEDPQAQFYLGVMYERGFPLKRNAPESMKWLIKAAEQGHEKAQVMLAVLYIKDKDLRPEFIKNIKRYRQKAEKGDPAAYYHLGWSTMEGAGLPPNFQEALKGYHLAAEQGNSLARLTLGDLYQTGKGTTANPKEALAWYRKSADTVRTARVKLCRLYLGQGGLPANEQEADSCLAALARSTDETLLSYIKTQQAILNSEKSRNPALALRACERLSALDPDLGTALNTCSAVKKGLHDKMQTRYQDAGAALEQKDWTRFFTQIDMLFTPDVDEEQIRKLTASAWQLMEEEARATEKTAQDQLRALEAADRSFSPRTSSVHQINNLISAFRTTVERGLRDTPEDTTLTALLRKGKKIIASLRLKMKALSAVDVKPQGDATDDVQEEADPAEEDYLKAQVLFNRGKFEDAERLFEKTTRTRGSRYIAQAYIYMGIGQLARINPAHINDARRRQLKGMAFFQNALRFDQSVNLPAGYDKYQPEFGKAREQMR